MAPIGEARKHEHRHGSARRPERPATTGRSPTPPCGRFLSRSDRPRRRGDRHLHRTGPDEMSGRTTATHASSHQSGRRPLVGDLRRLRGFAALLTAATNAHHRNVAFCLGGLSPQVLRHLAVIDPDHTLTVHAGAPATPAVPDRRAMAEPGTARRSGASGTSGDLPSARQGELDRGSTSWWVSATPPSVARSHATRGGPKPRSATARTRVSTTAAAASTRRSGSWPGSCARPSPRTGVGGISSTCSATCHERAARPARRTVGHAACPTTLRLAGYWPSRS